MNNNDVNEREMERLLEEHFASGPANVPPAPDLWGALESRLGEQDPKPLWAVLRDAGTPVDGFRFAPALAASAAVAVVAVAGGSVWLASGGFGGGGGGVPAALVATPTPAMEGSPGIPGVDRDDYSAAPTPTPAMLAEYPTPTPAMLAEHAVPTPAPEAMIGAPTPAPRAAPTPTPLYAIEESGPSAAQPGATMFRDYERQPLTDAREDNVSTFSLDTDRTSFQLALNWARAGYAVDPASVRAEEWVNAFDYGYAAPAATDHFAITSDLIAHPLDDGRHLARVAFKAPEVAQDGPLNVTLVLDASGSMNEGNRVAVARAAADAIRRSLDADDRISVVHFTTDVLHHFTVEDAPPGSGRVTRSIAQLAPHGSTNVQAGLDLGVQLADDMRRRRPEALNYVILMSDGVANVDATDPFAILEATSAPDGANPLRLITVGVGIENYNDHLLEQLAQHGNGWYRYLFDEEQARATFRRDNWLALASPVADQTRAQVTWNPGAVKAWRIVGYENRVTSAESFTQDRKEFAEVYSGAATTVFYELELHDDYHRQPALGQVELRWVEPQTGRGWSQTTDVVRLDEARAAYVDEARAAYVDEASAAYVDPMLAFGSVVALTADRYAALDAYPDPYATRGGYRDPYATRGGYRDPYATRGGYRDPYATRGGYRDPCGITRDLRTLQGLVDGLHGELGHLAAFNDFAFVLDWLLRSLPSAPPDTSGYSR